MGHMSHFGSSSMENQQQQQQQPPLRRARADTMPTYVDIHGNSNIPSTTTATNSSHLHLQATRNRSGSTASLFAGVTPSPYSPYESSSSVDDNASSTVASTLASLGLDDENNHTPSSDAAATTTTRSRSGSSSYSRLLDTLSDDLKRNRAYTIAAGRPPFPPHPHHHHAHPPPPPPSAVSFTPFATTTTQQQQQQRPRAISLGMMDGGVEMTSGGIPTSGNNGGINFFDMTSHHHQPPPPIPMTALQARLQQQHQQQQQQQRALRGSRSSGNLPELGGGGGTSRGFSRIGSHSQLSELSEMTVTKDFYAQQTGMMEPSSSPPSAPAQIPSRALWLGNINASVSVPDLIRMFSDYGHVESARILSDKECAFVNFNDVESAIAAKNDLETRLASMLAGTPVRVGYGKADVNLAMALTNEAGPNAQGPTRALWVGNIPANMNPAILRAIFQSFGAIDSVRVLSHKNCGFVNFEHQEDAVRARKSLQNKEILGPGTGTVRIGFAKVPSANEEGAAGIGQDWVAGAITNGSVQQQLSSSLNGAGGNSHAMTPEAYQATQWATAMMMSRLMKHTHMEEQEEDKDQETPDLHKAMVAERRFMMQQLGALDLMEEHEPITYSSVIPSVPEPMTERKVDVMRLREMRKVLDSGSISTQEAENFAMECRDDIVELCSDYIGNTVVQRIFEFCSDDTKQDLLERIAPHLASIGVHKNGTWAAQKIIDHASTPSQVQLVRENITSYVPLLLLDQFGNYVVQCCLNMGTCQNKFIFDAIVSKCWDISQGRFGARAIRAILENPLVTRDQQIYVASAIIQNAVLLATNTNGVLLLSWFMDHPELPGKFRVLCPRLLPFLAKLCTHKLGSTVVLKALQQDTEPEARHLLFKTLFRDDVLEEILMDLVHGVGFIQKVLAMSGLLDDRQREELAHQVKHVLVHRIKATAQHPQGYKKLMDMVDVLSPDAADTTEPHAPAKDANEQNDDKEEHKSTSWMQNPQAVAMVANMYAAAMTTAATTAMQQQPSSSTSSSSSSSEEANKPTAPMVDLAQFDQLLKKLLQQEKGNGNDNGNQS
ncbi:ARM repeat-containing protein [Lichtheimia hyalospora FSU 10163]|nr:ARM repeat-containing protein [Lichtheimia hyalospora FSU 10163]